MNKTATLNKPAKASLFYMGANLFCKGAGFLLLPLFTHRLSSEEYGLYALFTGWEAAVTVFTTFNLTGGTLYRGLQKNRERAEAYCSSLLILLLLTVSGGFLLFLLLQRQAQMISGMPLALWILLFADVLLNAVINLYAGFSRYRYRSAYPVLTSVALSAVSPAVALLLLHVFGIRAEARIFSSVAVSAVMAVIPLWRLRASVCQKTFGQLGRDFRTALRLCLPMLPHTFGLTVLSGADKLLMKKLCPPGDLGKYALAYSCAMALASIGNGAISSLGPWMMRKNASGESEAMRKTVSAVTRLYLPVILLFLCFLPEIFGFLAPPAYGDAILTVYPAALAVFPMFLSNLGTQAGMIYDQPLLFSLPSILGASVNLSLNLLLLPKVGYTAAGYVTLISYGVSCVTVFLLHGAKKRAPIIEGRKILGDFFLAAVSAEVIRMAANRFAYRLGCAFVLFAILLLNVKSGFSLLREKPPASVSHNAVKV